uniref:Non-structural polyprotein n=1 Tax=PNG bee virus 6 TaxID=2746883 RepID=A0A7D4XIS9_9VIRU|nr:non-structural polyprotein [PNG bee virus 6]
MCIKCETTTECIIKCVSPESPHFYCATCVALHRVHDTCPTCEIYTITASLTTQGHKWVSYLHSLKDMGEREVNALYKTFSSMTPYDHFKLFMQNELLTQVCSLFATRGISQATTIALQYSIWVSKRKSVHPSAETPSHCPQLEHLKHGRLTKDVLLETIAIPEPNMTRYTSFLAQAVQTEVCSHHIIFDAMNDGSTEYHAEDNEWRAAITEGDNTLWVVCKDQVCMNEFCLLRDAEECHRYYCRYAIRNSQQLRQIYINYILQPAHAQTWRNKVPFMLRPAWMQPPKIEISLAKVWWEYLSDTYTNHKNLVHTLAACSAIIGSVCLTVKLFNFVNQPVVIQNKLYDTENIRHLKRVHKQVRITGSRKDVKYQAEQNDQAIRDVVRRNYITIRVWHEGVCKRTLGILAVVGKYAIFPKHYFNYLRDSALQSRTITFERSIYVLSEFEGVPPNHTRHDYTFDPADFKLHETTDLAWIRLPASFASFRDIRKHFAKDDDLSTYLPNTGTLALVPTTHRKTVDMLPVNLYELQCEVVVAPSTETEAGIIRDVITYNHSENGICGSVLIADRSQRPLLSIHTAGASKWKTGYGTLITQELLDTFLPPQIMLQMEEHNLECVSTRENAFFLDPESKVEYLGCVPAGSENFSPPNTKIRPSLIHSVCTLVPLTEPSILSRRDPRHTYEFSPLYYGASKHGYRSRDFGSSIVEEACNAYYDGWLSNMRPLVMSPHKLTTKEAITGFPAVEFYDAMKLATSAGYPWTLKNKKNSTKEAWITATRDDAGTILDVTVHPELEQELQRKAALRSAGIQPLTIFADTLKDERKVPDKARKLGGTRVFCGSPVDYTIESRKHLLHFCAAFMSARFDVCSAVGINAKGMEWTDLYHYLTKTGATKIVTLDYSNFGPAFNAQVAESVKDLFVRWCVEHVKDAEPTAITMLLWECLNSVHIANNTVYQQFCGSPSGAPTTTIFNSLENILYIFVAWIKLVKPTLSPDLSLWKEFRDNVRFVVYGDDLIMSVTDQYITQFNMNTLQILFAKYGIVSTAADKTVGSSPDWMPLTNSTFLKRGFTKHPYREGVWLSPLNWVSINDATQWIWSCADHRAATLENCESALHEAHGHGRERFNTFKNEINRALVQIGCREHVMLDWQTLDNLYFPEFDINDVVSFQMANPDSLLDISLKVWLANYTTAWGWTLEKVEQTLADLQVVLAGTEFSDDPGIVHELHALNIRLGYTELDNICELWSQFDEYVLYIALLAIPEVVGINHRYQPYLRQNSLQ